MLVAVEVGDDRPAHFLSELQAGGIELAVEDAGQARQRLGAGGHAHIEIEPAALDVGVGLVRQHAVPGHLLQGGIGLLRIRAIEAHGVEVGLRLDDLAQHVAEQGVVLLLRRIVQGHGDEVVQRQLGVAHAVPQALPQHGAQQRIVDLRQLGARGIEGAGVQLDFRIAPVLVVRVDQVRAGRAVQILDRGPGALVGHRHVLDQGQLAAVDLERRHLHALFAQGRQLLARGGLGQGEVLDLAVAAAVVGGDRVHAGVVQPFPGPAREVAAGGLGQRVDEVVEGGVLPRILDQVVVHALAEHFLAQQVAQLLEGGAAFRVRDGVDIVEGVGRRRHRHLDRVGARGLVLDVGALLAGLVELLPRVLELGRFGGGQDAHEGREALVQPQAVPPLHGDQVAEPLVGHLVHDYFGHRLLLVGRHIGHAIARFGEGDGAGVFHGAVQEVGHDQLVVFFEGVGNAEVLFEEGHAGLGLAEPVGRDHLLGQRLAREQAHRVLAAIVFPDLVGAGVQREVVGAEAFRLFEGPAAVGAGFIDPGLAGGGDHVPVLRRGDGNRVAGLQVGLVEQREHLLGGHRLEVRIRIYPSIGRVDHAMQAFAIGAVQALVGDGDGVAPLGQVRRVDGDEPVVVARLDRLAVDADRLDGGLVQVEGDGGIRVLEVEGDGRGAGKGFLAGQGKVQHIVHVRDAGGTGKRIVLREEGGFGAGPGGLLAWGGVDGAADDEGGSDGDGHHAVCGKVH